MVRAVIEKLSDRLETVLKAVIKDYIEKVEPVSSRAIAARHAVALSPASIRSILVELENAGYLYQPHTSAGRIPTEKSFRFYVDSLVEPEEVLASDKDLIRTSCSLLCSTDSMMIEAARILSTLTCCASFLLAPMAERQTVKSIRFIRIDSGKILFVVVFDQGLARTRVVRIDRNLETLDLEKASNYLNTLAVGKTLNELRTRVAGELELDSNLYDEFLSGVLKLGGIVLLQDAENPDVEVYIEGKTNILAQPEFSEDLAKLRRLLAALEQKSLMLRILDLSMKDDGLHIYMGSECKMGGLEGLSLVTAPYGPDGANLGTLGVIGPIRMNYSKIIPLVDYTAQSLGQAF